MSIFKGQFISYQIFWLHHKLKPILLAYQPTHSFNLIRICWAVHLGKNPHLIFKMAVIFPNKLKVSKISPYIVDNSHIHLHFLARRRPIQYLLPNFQFRARDNKLHSAHTYWQTYSYCKKKIWTNQNMYVYVCERGCVCEGEGVCVCVRVCVWGCMWASVCVCVWVSQKC